MPDERFEKLPKDERPWHQKSPYAGVKNDPNELIVENGRIRGGVNITLTAEALEQTHQGRRCGWCQEPFILEAWPKLCPLCGHNVQKAYDLFKRRFQGEEWVGTTIDFHKEIDSLDAQLEQDNWEANPTSSIVLPKGVKL